MDFLDNRYELAIQRIKEINDDFINKRASLEWQTNFVNDEEKTLYDLLVEVFGVLTGKIIIIDDLKNKLDACEDKLGNHLDADVLKNINDEFYSDIVGNAYDKCIGNPQFFYGQTAFMNSESGRKKLTQIVSFMYAEIISLYSDAYNGYLIKLVTVAELLLECFGIAFEDEAVNNKLKYIKEAIYYYESDYVDVWTRNKVARILDDENNHLTDIIMRADLSDEKHLYLTGEYIGDTERRMSQFFAKMDEDKLSSMAKTLVDGYLEGFRREKIDLTNKKTVNIRYNIGFERMVRMVVLHLKEFGLEPVVYNWSQSGIDRGVRKSGTVSLGPNPQYDYDHRFDKAVFLDKELLDSMIVHYEKAYQEFEKQASEYAGPMLIEVFGQIPFSPRKLKEANSFTDKQNKLFTEYTTKLAVMTNKYVNQEEVSFSIISYPIDEIGADFEEIFEETIKVNTLDVNVYEKIQQKIIDTLDMADHVIVEGMNGNKTKLKIALAKLDNPDKETRFENCLADVNIPLGEVFTSPKLIGTNGILNVSHVYLNDLLYKDLVIEFENGMVTEYNCSNNSEDEENKKYIKENVLFSHDTLPIGEFAIGTNTVAYAMGRRYNIAGKLPILIAEKTGPHFAIGDTCYRMSEDSKTYNSDGKQIVAKDNEVTLLRKTDSSKAYFGCHTDITIPYDELGLLSAVMEDGSRVDIICEGRFVLEGCDKLNESLA